MADIPKKKMLIGHTEDEDYYETPEGEIWVYGGSQKKDWKQKKYWARVVHRNDVNLINYFDKEKLMKIRKVV